jgi:hypothetical protein
MNLLSTPAAKASIGKLVWNRIAQRKPKGRDERPAPIDADELSDHMLRDLGILDGRPGRGERPVTNDLNELLRDMPKRFL